MPYEGLDFVDNPDNVGIPQVSDDVSWDVFCRPEEVGARQEWPPHRFRARDQRIELLTAFWRGELPGVGLGENKVILNLFYSYSTELANLLLMSEPEAAGVDSKILADVAHECLIDMTRYGGAILMISDGMLSVQTPDTWYPTREQGDIFVKPFLSDEADSVELDQAQVIMVHPSGMVDELIYRWDNGRLGRLLGQVERGSGQVVVVPRDPKAGIWGTAKYYELYPVVAELAKRLSMNSRVLDLFAKPVPIFRESDYDARQKAGITDDLTPAQEREKFLEYYTDVVHGEVVHLSDSKSELLFAQPSTMGVEHAMGQAEFLMEAYRTIAGLPNLQGQTLSGEALKRLFVHFYAESKAMQNSARDGLEELLGTTVTWEHVFDSDVFSAMPDEAQNDAEEPEQDSDREFNA